MSESRRARVRVCPFTRVIFFGFTERGGIVESVYSLYVSPGDPASWPLNRWEKQSA
ncbi:hypothetical protein EI94DRAFT_1560580 [Lactarius quietus]|nr:hypothetical protein EI94DRAFT_1560580 [Lactarius quietus]